LSDRGPGSRAAAVAANLPMLVKTLVCGAIGGAAFVWMQMPLPWMLGSLTLVMALSLAGWRFYLPNPFRRIWMVVLGVMLGSTFTPDVLDHATQWGATFLGMIAFTMIGTALAAWFFRRVGGFDPATAFFSATPGGLGDMMILGPAMGGDERTIVLIHATRIIIVMFTVPLAYRLLAGYVPTATLGSGGSIVGMAPVELGLLTAAGVVGAVAGRLLRVPAWQTIGPMLVSAAIHISGWTAAKPPYELVAAAQVVIGAGAGARFMGVRMRELSWPILLSALASLGLLAMALVAALGMAAFTGIDFRAIHLAYAPGGFAEMNLIALSLGIEVAFVATHHLGRLFLVVMLATVLAKFYWGRRLERERAAAARAAAATDDDRKEGTDR